MSLSKKQSLVARSSTEAEIIALNTVAQDVKWMRGLLAELGYEQAEPTVLHEDNRACIILMTRGHPGRMSRSIEIKYFAMADEVGELYSIKFTPTEHQIANGLTKPLPKKSVQRNWASDLLNHKALPAKLKQLKGIL